MAVQETNPLSILQHHGLSSHVDCEISLLSGCPAPRLVQAAFSSMTRMIHLECRHALKAAHAPAPSLLLCAPIRPKTPPGFADHEVSACHALLPSFSWPVPFIPNIGTVGLLWVFLSSWSTTLFKPPSNTKHDFYYKCLKASMSQYHHPYPGICAKQEK